MGDFHESSCVVFCTNDGYDDRDDVEHCNVDHQCHDDCPYLGFGYHEYRAAVGAVFADRLYEALVED